MLSKMVFDEILVKIQQLCQSQGFVYEVLSHGSSRQYGFGPAGTLLRRNILQEWYQAMVSTQENTYVVEESPFRPAGGATVGIPLSGDGQKVLRQTEHSESENKLRTSLSEGCLSHYLRVLELTNQRFPFSISQTGVYRDMSQSNTFLISSTEQTGMMLQYFSPPSLSTQSYDNWQRSRLKWWRQYSQNPSNFSLSDIKSESGLMKTEIQYDFSWGKDSIETITNRGDTELRQMESETGFSNQGKHGRKSVYPVIIETCTSLERAMLAFIADAFTEKDKLHSKDKLKGTRTLLRINRRLAPYKVAIAISGPGARELREVANHTARDLRNSGIEVFDAMFESSQSLENQTNRFDELGIPFSVILNATSLKDGIVGMRNRDTTLKEQVHISRLKDTIWRNIKLS